MLLQYPSQLFEDAWIGILHGIEHASDHLTIGDSPAIGCAEGKTPNLELFDERLREVQGCLFKLCHTNDCWYLTQIRIILIKTIKIGCLVRRINYKNRRHN